MKLSKEEVLNLLKELVAQVRDNGEKLKHDKRMYDEFVVRRSTLNNAVNSLNSCDSSWVNDEFGKWHKIEIEPFMRGKNEKIF